MIRARENLEVLEGAIERGLRRRAEDVLAEAERRAAARRFASFQEAEVVALLVATRTALRRPRGGLSDASWLALVGIGRELEGDIEARLRRVAR